MTRNLVKSLRLWLAPAAVWLASVAPVHAQELFGGWGGAADACSTCTTVFGCQTHHCPPALSHCQERPPCIRVKCGCPKPICNPCNQPGWGYYETCWSPWPWPPNYNHCATLPPAATIALSGPNNPGVYPYQGQGDPRIQPMPQQRPTQGQFAPNMPPVTAPPVSTTPIMPRTAPNPNNPMPNFQPMPGGGIDSLPVPRPDAPPRPLPSPGGAF